MKAVSLGLTLILFDVPGPSAVSTNPFPLTEATTTTSNEKNFHNSGSTSSTSSNPFVSEKFQESAGPVSLGGDVAGAGAHRRIGSDSQPASFQRFEI